MTRTGTLLAFAVALGVAGAWSAPAAAQSYVAKKDEEAIGVIDRAMAKVAEDPTLFDGKVIPAGADLQKVGELARRLHDQLDAANRAYNDLSAAGRAQARVQTLMQTWKRLAAYDDALVPVYNAAAAAAREASAKQAAADAVAHDAGLATCKSFRDQILADPTDRERLDRLAQIAEGVPTYWQDVDSGAKHHAILVKAAALCARPELADIGRACGFMEVGAGEHPEARWCAAVAKGDELMKQAVRNLAAFDAANLTAGRGADQIEHLEGWVDIEGPVTWKEYFSGATLRAMLTKRLAPVFAQAGITSIDDLEVFRQLDTHFATLATKVTELAPTWKLPGRPCGGVACAAARKTAAAWYPKARIKKVLEDAHDWTVVQDELGRPDHRYKGGYVLLQVAGDPFCQLRSWTVTEDHQGGGRYQAASGSTIGYVRWQTCK